jgi:hypothetical protein
MSLQTPINQLDLFEWLIASIGLVVVVTLVYIYVLNKSPPPEGATVSKIEQSNLVMQASHDPNPVLSEAETSRKSNNLNAAVENSAEAVRICLSGELRRITGRSSEGMGISDIAYLLQSKEKSGPQFAEPVYQLSNLRLKVVQTQTISDDEASWAVSFAAWLVNAFQTDQVKF